MSQEALIMRQLLTLQKQVTDLGMAANILSGRIDALEHTAGDSKEAGALGEPNLQRSYMLGYSDGYLAGLRDQDCDDPGH